MAGKRWQWWGGAVLVALGLWSLGVGGVQAYAVPDATPGVHAKPAAYFAAVAQQRPCPIEVPGGVICHGPVFPGYPPAGQSTVLTVYLPVVVW